MNERQKGVKALNPLTILYLVIALAVISAIFDYRVTLATVAVMILIAASAGEGVSFIKLWLKSIVLICVICFILQSLFIPGEEVLWSFWVLSIKMESVQKAIVLCSRIMGIGSAILLGGKLIEIKRLMVMPGEERDVSLRHLYPGFHHQHHPPDVQEDERHPGSAEIQGDRDRQQYDRAGESFLPVRRTADPQFTGQRGRAGDHAGGKGIFRTL